MICKRCKQEMAKTHIEKLLIDADKAFIRLNNRYNKGENNDGNNSKKENNDKERSRRNSNDVSYTEPVGHY